MSAKFATEMELLGPFGSLGASGRPLSSSRNSPHLSAISRQTLAISGRTSNIRSILRRIARSPRGRTPNHALGFQLADVGLGTVEVQRQCRRANSISHRVRSCCVATLVIRRRSIQQPCTKPLNGESLIACLEMALIGGGTRPPPYRAFSARHDVYGFL